MEQRYNVMSVEHIEQKVARIIGGKGLIVHGALNLTDSLTGHPEMKSLLLIGSAGSSFWKIFRSSAEYADGNPNPLDRWSQRIGDDLAQLLSGVSLYPFEGPPYWPFLQWAAISAPLESSPIGVAMHPDYGLWHAYRLALALPYALKINAERAEPQGICVACVEKPCLTHCPVEAFSVDGYDVETCYTYLVSNSNAPCHQHGCIARKACPTAQTWQYESEHAGFHMAAFLRAREEKMP